MGGPLPDYDPGQLELDELSPYPADPTVPEAALKSRAWLCADDRVLMNRGRPEAPELNGDLAPPRLGQASFAHVEIPTATAPDAIEEA